MSLSGVSRASVQSSSASAKPAITLGLIVAIILTVVVPSVVVVILPPETDFAWSSVLLITTISGGRLGQLLASASARVYEAVVWLFAYIFLGLAPLVQLLSGDTPGTTPNVHRDLDVETVIVITIGAAGLIIGSTLASFRRLSVVDPGVLRAGQFSPRRAGILAILAVCFAAYFLIRVGAAVFGTREDLTSATASLAADSLTRVILVAVVVMSLLVSAAVAIRRLRSDIKPSRPQVALAIFLAIVTLVCVNPLSSPRYLFGTVAVGLLAAVGMFETVVRTRVTILSALLALVLLFPLLNVFRYNNEADTGVVLDNPLTALTSPDFDSFNQINNTLLYVDSNGITWGRQALGVALFWVPRALWPDKPLDTGILIANFRGYATTNLSAPLWAEEYINGGLAFVLVAMIGLGWLLRRLDSRLDTAVKSGSGPPVLDCILPFYMLLLLRGSLLQAMSYLVVLVICVAFVGAFGRSSYRIDHL